MSDSSFFQTKMLPNQPLGDTGNHNEPLAAILRRFDFGQILIPPFQRDFVWKNDKVRGWATSIKSRKAIGVIVTYQLVIPEYEGHHPVYLADGLQRLSAAQKIKDYPQDYGFVDEEDIEMHLDAFRVTVQHRHYKDHDEAFSAFQLLNYGTAATPADVYKGELTNIPTGRKLYQSLEAVFQKCENRIVRRQHKVNYETSSKYERDRLALFLQYVTQAKFLNLWNVAQNKVVIGQDMPLERLLAEHVKSRDWSALQNEINAFEKFLDETIALMSSRLLYVRGEGYAISPGLFRHLLHLAIYRRNTRNLTTDAYRMYLDTVFTHSKSLNTQVLLPDREGICNLQIGALGGAFHVCDYYDIPHTAGRRKRSKRPVNLQKGYDNSHTLPHQQGMTFPEPAALNRARGAHPVTDEELHSHISHMQNQ